MHVGALSPMTPAFVRELIRSPGKLKKNTHLAGAVLFLAADRALRSDAVRATSTPRSECLAYRDAAVLRGVYGVAPAKNVTPEQVESLFDALVMRSFILWHTLKLDREDPLGWIDRCVAAYQRMRADLRYLAAAVACPDADKQRRYVTGPGFFGAADPVVRMIRPAAAAERAATGAKAVADAGPTSCYGRAVRDGCLALLAVADVRRGTIGPDELERRVNA
jgi:hypothetical protein